MTDYIGPRRRGGLPPIEYVQEVWQERDNFERVERAREYAEYKSRQFPATPYRITERVSYVVEFVPSWHLRAKDGKPTQDSEALSEEVSE